ncbi:hypothetical protein BLA29_009768 [Euroglyphus maynei]|uniref:Uncharacterized protein n=1 Tax=Euroglyphus maynei TaxID=6958 RepID=A0A1Y3BLX7_EURMA|nr:hypothetical protein BLA29_009768 [Euroglyphus maynei]
MKILYDHYHFLIINIMAIMLHSDIRAFGQNQMTLTGNNGVRDAILAINAYCDNTCTNPVNHNWIAYCFQQAANYNDHIIQMMRTCTAQRNFIINCNHYSLIQLERCLIHSSYNNRFLSQQNDWSRQCFHNSITLRTRNCLRYNYPRLRWYIPQRPSY